MYGVIYKATNLINKKIYIGQTTKTLKIRTWYHNNSAKLKRKQLICRAINKYGENNFIWEVIDSANSREELNKKEKYYILQYNSFIHNKDSHGYNMTLGGEGMSGRILTLEQRMIISKTHKGKIVSEETRKKMSESSNQMGEKNSMYGKKQSKYSIQKNKLNQPNKLSVLQFSLDGNLIKEHDSIREGASFINGHSGDIIYCCKGKSKTAKGYIWIYKKDYSADFLIERISNAKNKRQVSPVLVFSKEDVFIKEYKSIAEASKELECDLSSIVKCCKGKLKTHKGYKFTYKNNRMD